jgi:hypothetical protein
MYIGPDTGTGIAVFLSEAGLATQFFAHSQMDFE